MLKLLLKKLAWPEFKTWLQVYEWSEKYPLPHKSGRSSGDATVKIGYMLQELGVLSPKSQELGRQKRSLMASFTRQAIKWIDPFTKQLEKSGCAPSTILSYLRFLKDFNHWLSRVYPEATLLHVNQQMIRRYLDAIHENTTRGKYLRDVFNSLNKFYRWAKREKLVLINPFDNLTVNREAQRLRVCSPSDLQKIIAFIKNADSDPEQALLLTLILFYGMEIEDLRFTKIEVFSDQLILLLHQKQLSRGKRFYNREQSLKLPHKSNWFLNLQKRFYLKWSRQYQKTKKSYPQHWLLLPYHHNYNRPLSYDTVSKRIQEATTAATGHPVPAKVLRQTCGNIYSRNQDASVLTKLGWSPQFAFHYTWLPRQYFTVNQK